MTRPVCDARTAAWEAIHAVDRLRAIYPKEGAATDPAMHPATLIPCKRPDGCGAAAGEECREPACGKCGGYLADGARPADRCACADATPAIGAHPDAISGNICCGKCGGYLTGEIDRCVCDDAKPRVDVSALLAERDRLAGILTAPLPEELAEIEARAEAVKPRKPPGDPWELTSNDPWLVDELRAQAATIRERDAEVARLDRLAKEERALRLALAAWVCSRDTAEESVKHSALVVAEQRLRAAGGVP